MKKTDNNETRSTRFIRTVGICMLPFFIVCLSLNMVKDLVKDIIADSNSYELRYEEVTVTDTDGNETDMSNGQKVYALYRNGEYFDEVDYNEFTLKDENGDTDLRYCVLIKDARRVAYTAIFAAITIVVIMITISITNGRTPFTPANAKRIKAIGILQLSLAIVPGLVVLIMKMARYSYIHSTFDIGSVYMFIIAFVIMIIGMVFDYGVKLQQDNDLIA
ncbi:DUF2975 domain-containing protein [Ruminococcus sp. NK3A76]|uniref:DUF2975 domain-containing protein n=1 Tax=Ruminococcus sp. NK3A76 TaxID=877411 RepID=UPI00048F431E|nr:DUF2975 domain-containing protein [Ruminococcus sp. NK3A76]